MGCKHKTVTIIERVFVEKSFEVDDGQTPAGGGDWYSDPIMWHGPQLISITAACSDCGYEQIYGPRAKLPKWVQVAWDALTRERQEV